MEKSVDFRLEMFYCFPWEHLSKYLGEGSILLDLASPNVFLFVSPISLYLFLKEHTHSWPDDAEDDAEDDADPEDPLTVHLEDVFHFISFRKYLGVLPHPPWRSNLGTVQKC